MRGLLLIFAIGLYCFLLGAAVAQIAGNFSGGGPRFDRRDQTGMGFGGSLGTPITPPVGCGVGTLDFTDACNLPFGG